MKEPVEIHERVAGATQSSHLQHKPEPCAIDTVGALGMASLENKLSSAVFRLKYGNEARFYREAWSVIEGQANRLAVRYAWDGVDKAILRDLSQQVLDYWLNDGCPHCDGLGYEKLVGAPVLSDVACKVCRGTTKRRIPKQSSLVGRDRFLLLLATIEAMEAAAGAQVMRRIAKRMDAD